MEVAKPETEYNQRSHAHAGGRETIAMHESAQADQRGKSSKRTDHPYGEGARYRKRGALARIVRATWLWDDAKKEPYQCAESRKREKQTKAALPATLCRAIDVMHIRPILTVQIVMSAQRARIDRSSGLRMNMYLRNHRSAFVGIRAESVLPRCVLSHSQRGRRAC
jgi:hypothetical protein